jgi:hypothetical protein
MEKKIIVFVILCILAVFIGVVCHEGEKAKAVEIASEIDLGEIHIWK